jgi:hypothetical protein
MFTAVKECKKGKKRRKWIRAKRTFLKDGFSNADILNTAGFILFLGVPTELTATLSLYDLLTWPTTKGSLSIITATHPAGLLNHTDVMNISRTS